MKYSNPQEAWYHEQKKRPQGDGCMLSVVSIAFLILTIALMLAFSGCTTTKYVPATETHTEHHWHTDSVKERDSTHTERNTIIRELDSAAMAKYGIQMQANQRAWLVLQREMENRLRELEHMSTQRDTVHDTIPQPYPVEKLVPAELSWWQQARIHLANILLAGLLIVGIILLGKWHLKKLQP